MKNSGQSRRHAGTDTSAEYHAWPASGFLLRRVVRRIDLSRIIASDVFPFPGDVFRVIESRCFPSATRKKRRSPRITACLYIPSERSSSWLSLTRKKIANGYNNCAWSSDGVPIGHRNDIRGCRWQMKQSACPLSQLQTREVKLH